MIVLGISDFTWEKIVVFVQSGCVRAKVVVSGQNWLYSGKVVVFEQSRCILAKPVVFGQK